MTENVRKFPIGIDLGTTNSAVGISIIDMLEMTENREGKRINPSYVYYENNTELIGRMARDRGGIDPQNVCFDSKRLLAETMNSPNVEEFRKLWPFEVTNKSDDTYVRKALYRTYNEKEKKYKLIPPERVSSDILKSMLNDVRRKIDLGSYDIEAVIAVPAYFSINQKRATIEAAKAVGIPVKRLISEPVAAALAYQLEVISQSKQEKQKDEELKEKEYVFVFDLGGGTFDVTIMEMGKDSYNVIALGGDSHLGGRDFDNVIAKMIKELLNEQLGAELVNEKMRQSKYRHRLIEASREAKETLTQADEETVTLSDIIPDADDGTITRTDFERNSEPLWEKIAKCCTNTLHDAELKPDQIDHIILVGGSSKLTKVNTLLQEIFGTEKQFSRALSPDESIAKGATILAGKLVLYNEEIFKDALPQSIGIEVAGNKFEAIIQHNTRIPCEEKKILKTSVDGQTEAQIPIYEGLSENIEENVYIGTLEITEIPHKKAGEVTLEITFKIDNNGILQSEANAVIEGVSTKVKAEIDFEMQYSFEIIEEMEE